MKPNTTLRTALADPALLGTVIAGPSWAAWRALLLATVGEKLTASELEVFTKYTGRTTPPTAMVDEAAFVIGRRGGKDRAASVLATYIAGLCSHDDVLARGERGVLLCIAPDQRQAKIQLSYIDGAFAASPILAQLVVGRSADAIELSNRVSIEVRAASFRRLRGVTSIAVIATEAAFWFTEESAANADTEILGAVRPSLATTGGPLVIISSPYAKRGELWNLYRRHYGPEGDPQILVAQGASRDFNPTLSERVVTRALDRDRAAAAAEYLAEFRADLESYITREAVEACVANGVRERAPVAGTGYVAFCDPAGGSGADAMTLAIAHRENDVAVLDALREVRPRFSPETVVDDFASLLKSYSIYKVHGDRYAGGWPAEQFGKRGITYEPADKPKSDIYRDALPLINSGKVALLDNARLLGQFTSLERRKARSGRDTIDHPPNAHDDLCNAACGALVALSSQYGSYDTSMNWVGGSQEIDDAWHMMRLQRHMRIGGSW